LLLFVFKLEICSLCSYLLTKLLNFLITFDVVDSYVIHEHGMG